LDFQKAEFLLDVENIRNPVHVLPDIVKPLQYVKDNPKKSSASWYVLTKIDE
jgi:hypothetical protein